MLVATCVVKLSLASANSLKDKRQIVKSVLARLPRHFNVAVAETEHQDVWRTAVIAMAAVGVDAGYLHGLLESAVAWLEENRPDAIIEEYSIEFS